MPDAFEVQVQVHLKCKCKCIWSASASAFEVQVSMWRQASTSCQIWLSAAHKKIAATASAAKILNNLSELFVLVLQP